MSLRIFIHGLDSSNQGTKAIFFRERFPDMVIPNFDGSLENRMENLEDILSEGSGISIVGSSFGGLMATIFAMKFEARVDRLILLAPAINMIRHTTYEVREISTPVHIYHGVNDAVIPLADVDREAKSIFHNLTLNIVEDDHLLHKTFKGIDWKTLLGD